jgi:hypothetical protein
VKCGLLIWAWQLKLAQSLSFPAMTLTRQEARGQEEFIKKQIEFGN